VTWNYILVLGGIVSLVTVALARGARRASESEVERRYRWAIRLTLGYGGLLLLGLLLALARFGWASLHAASVEERTVLLGVCLASAFNLVLGLLAFGTAPTLVAFMLARLMKTESNDPG
jgi:uncharacterized membrane protein